MTHPIDQVIGKVLIPTGRKSMSFAELSRLELQLTPDYDGYQQVTERTLRLGFTQRLIEAHERIAATMAKRKGTK